MGHLLGHGISFGADDGFFQERLTRSPWFWLDILGLICLTVIAFWHPKALSQRWLITGVAWSCSVGGVLWAVQGYHQIQAMNIDWATAQPGTPLHQVLAQLASDIQTVPWVVMVMAVAMVGS